ncbi:MAG: hypothetical protein ACREI9_12735 [Nitrospiraceae bacterium]
MLEIYFQTPITVRSRFREPPVDTADLLLSEPPPPPLRAVND